MIVFMHNQQSYRVICFFVFLFQLLFLVLQVETTVQAAGCGHDLAGMTVSRSVYSSVYSSVYNDMKKPFKEVCTDPPLPITTAINQTFVPQGNLNGLVQTGTLILSSEQGIQEILFRSYESEPINDPTSRRSIIRIKLPILKIEVQSSENSTHVTVIDSQSIRVQSTGGEPVRLHYRIYFCDYAVVESISDPSSKYHVGQRVGVYRAIYNGDMISEKH
jgi:hypothetical protein